MQSTKYNEECNSAGMEKERKQCEPFLVVNNIDEEFKRSFPVLPEDIVDEDSDSDSDEAISSETKVKSSRFRKLFQFLLHPRRRNIVGQEKVPKFPSQGLNVIWEDALIVLNRKQSDKPEDDQTDQILLFSRKKHRMAVCEKGARDRENFLKLFYTYLSLKNLQHYQIF